MTAVDIRGTKEITSISGCKLYRIYQLTDGYTLDVPFGKVWAVFIQVVYAGVSEYVSYTLSGSRITFEKSAGSTIDLDVMVWGE